MIENRFGCAESIELGTTSALRLMLDIDMRKPKTNATENNIFGRRGLHFAIFGLATKIGHNLSLKKSHLSRVLRPE